MEKNTWKKTFDFRTRGEETRSREAVVMPAKRAKGSEGEGETGKKAKSTQDAGGSKTQYFVREVKGRRMTKNEVEFLIG